MENTDDNSENKCIEKALTYIIQQIKQAEIYMIESKYLVDFSCYSEVEKKLLEYINKIPLIEEKQKKKLKKDLYKLLKERYELNPNNIDSHQQFQIQVEKLFNIYMTTMFDCSEELLIFSQTGNESKDAKELKNFFNYLRHIKVADLCFFIKDSMELNFSLPQFFLLNHFKVIKERIIVVWILNYNKFYIQNKLESNPDYKFLYKQYSDFFDDRINIFDEKYLNKEELNLLFQALYFSNGEYLRYDSNVTIFLNNSRRYLDLMHFERKEHSKMVSECFDYLKSNNKAQIDMKLKEIFSQLQNRIGPLDKGKINEKLLFVIFSFSCVLNGVIYAEMEQNLKAVFASSLKCSAKEREFLYNFLHKFDIFLKTYDNKCLYFNYLMENEVLSSLFKSYTKVLYDEQNKSKINFSYDRVMYLVSKSGIKRKQNDEDEEDQEYLFDQLNDLEKEDFTVLFNKFKEDIHENEGEETSKKPKKGLLSTIGKIGEVASMIQIYKPIMKDRQTNLLLPINPLNISNHICICISGIFMNEDLPLNDINIWFNITNKKQTVDYYVYNWQNEDNTNLGNGNIVKNVLSFVKSTVTSKPIEHNIIKDNKKMSKKFGRLLAYIIASHSIFKFHTISLMGFSLGCNVIKNCLKELQRINSSIDVSDIIQNVIFLGGATTFTTKHQKIFSLVSGNVYNFYSHVDKMLSTYYSENSIGNKELRFNINNDTESDVLNSYQPNYINCDVTNNQYNQGTYGIGINKLLKIIKF